MLFANELQWLMSEALRGIIPRKARRGYQRNISRISLKRPERTGPEQSKRAIRCN